MTTADSIAQPGALDPATRPALYALIASLADNKLVLGRRYAEWCTGAPLLEAAVAAAGMAQDELGHARALYPVLRQFPEATEAATREEAGWQDRPTSALACLDRPLASWSEFAAANLIVDGALSVLIEAAVESRFEPLRQRARKMAQEEEPHRVHGEGWARRLGRDPAAREAFARAAARAWPEALAWFGPSDDPVVAPLAAAGILSAGPEELRGRFVARVRPALAAAELWDEARFPLDPPWARWDAPGRRLRPA